MDRKAYQREYARRKYAKRDAEANRGQQFCQHRHGPGRCGGRLETEVVRGGATHTYCPRCRRRAAGQCIDCTRPVEGQRGKALRCAACKARARNHYQAVHRERHRDEINRQQKARRTRLDRDPEYRARRLAVKKAWRERNVVRIKLSKRKWRLNPERPNGYSSREKYEAYHRAYRAKHAERRRELARKKYYELHPDRPHPVCHCGCDQEIPWDGRGRPRLYLVEHNPYHDSPRKRLMKAIDRAIKGLERQAAKIKKQLEGTDQLKAELDAIERAVGELRPHLDASTPADGRQTRRGRGAKAGA